MTTHQGGGGRGFWVSLAAVLLLAALVGCGGDDDDGEDEGTPVAGSFVGEIQGTEALVAVVASPLGEGREERDVTVYACDGTRTCELFSGSASGNDFEAASDDGAVANAELSDETATGTIELPDGEAQYTAGQAKASSGIYDLSVSTDGELRGVSATGVALTGETTLPKPGPGTLTLADRTRLKFEIASSSGGDSVPLRAGQVRLIVLPDGRLAGAGRNRGDGGDSDFFVSSPSK